MVLWHYGQVTKIRHDQYATIVTTPQSSSNHCRVLAACSRVPGG